MARKIPVTDPLAKIKGLRNVALDAVKHPRTASGRVVDQAKGVASAGRQVAEGVAGQVIDQVSRQVSRRRASDAPRAASKQGRIAEPAEASRKIHGDPLAPTQSKTPTPAPTPVTVADRVEDSDLGPAPTAEDRAAAHRASPAEVAKKVAKKAPAKKTPASKAPAKKTPASKAPGDKLPPRAAATKPTPPPAPRDIEPNPEAMP